MFIDRHIAKTDRRSEERNVSKIGTCLLDFRSFERRLRETVASIYRHATPNEVNRNNLTDGVLLSPKTCPLLTSLHRSAIIPIFKKMCLTRFLAGLPPVIESHQSITGNYA